ncbi:MAG TPA: carboxypeptidase regulatory-like domain-containing protein [Nocardioidaceae bacterium]|nr:carboxypeptidase regulatory-like domain-containing protein [Nocardioidaceae bacterium]
MTALASSALAVGLIPAAVGQAAADPSAHRPGHAPRAASVGQVTGTVVNGKGDPIEGALVNVLRPSEVVERGIIAADTPRRDWTNANGKFSVRQTGQYLVQICVPDRGDKTVCRETAQGVKYIITFVGPSGTTDSWVTQTSLFEGAPADNALGEITVKPQGFIEGHVEGAPAFHSISLLRLNDTVAYRDVTDKNGDYRLRGLAPGPYKVSLGGEGFLPSMSDIVNVRAHRTSTVDATLDRGGVIRGKLLSGGKPVIFTDVIIKTGGDIVAAATTNRNGVYRASGFTPGNYRLGITYYGTRYLQKTVKATLAAPDSHVVKDIVLRRGSAVIVDPRADGTTVTDVVDELRDQHGVPLMSGIRLRDGRIKYQGLAAGNYTVVVSDGDAYGRKSFSVVGKGRIGDLGRIALTRPTFSLSGQTAPHAVVEATTGDLCPPGGPVRLAAFHFIADRADASGNYELSGLVPGRYMLGSDGWPRNFVPRCWSGVRLSDDTVRDLPLADGAIASGRLVYDDTGTPIITSLSYELLYQQPSTTSPTDEHPSRARSVGATGEFAIDALGSGDVVGRLAQTIDDSQINSEEFFVIFPYQDFTPYYLESADDSITINAGVDVDLGDIPLTLGGSPS